MQPSPSASAPLIWVIILNWNSSADTLACVDSVRTQGDADWRLVVCDNASADDSLNQLRIGLRERFGAQLTEWTEADWSACPPPVTKAHLIANKANHGYAGGNNVGIRLALRDPHMAAVLILNNDTEMEPSGLAELAQHFRDHPRDGTVGCTLVFHDQPNLLQAAGGGTHARWTGRALHHGYGQTRQSVANYINKPLDYVYGAAMLIRRECLDIVGLMPEDFFLYYEELDYANRVRPHFTIGYCPTAVVRHKEGGSTGGKRSNVSRLAEFHLIRNRLRVTKRYYSSAMPTVLLWLVVPILRHLLAGRFDRAALIVRIAAHYDTITWSCP